MYSELKWSCLSEHHPGIILGLSNSPVCRDVAGLFIMYEHGAQCNSPPVRPSVRRAPVRTPQYVLQTGVRSIGPSAIVMYCTRQEREIEEFYFIDILQSSSFHCFKDIRLIIT